MKRISVLLIMGVSILFLQGCADEFHVETIPSEYSSEYESLATTSISTLEDSNAQGNDPETEETLLSEADSMTTDVSLEDNEKLQGFGISTPAINGWSATVSYLPGLPLYLDIPNYDNVTFQVSLSDGRFFYQEKANYSPGLDPGKLITEVVLGQNFTVPNGIQLYWDNWTGVYDDRGNEIRWGGEIAYADIVIFDGDRIIGYAVVKIYTTNYQGAGSQFKNKVLETVMFSMDGNELKEISLDYVESCIADAKNHVETEVVHTESGLVYEYTIEGAIRLTDLIWFQNDSRKPGLPIQLKWPSGNNITIFAKADDGSLFYEGNLLNDAIGIKNETEIYWRNEIYEGDSKLSWNEPFTYVDIIVYENDAIIGYAVVEFRYHKGKNTIYEPILLKSVSFISPDKAYQNITLDYVQERFMKAKEVR